jgi:methanogenic corrinoid protein MtbC1
MGRVNVLIDLAELTQAMGSLDEDKINKILGEFIASKPDLQDTHKVVEACQQGMAIVGDNYERGEYFLADLIFAGELLSNCVNALKPLLGGDYRGMCGKMVLGTVKGDIHDIGKNIFKNMAEAAGCDVIDLCIDQSPEVFVTAVRENKPQIVGMSGVLTLSIDSMKKTVDSLKAAGLRDGVKVAIGGNAVSEEACRYVGADAWSRNAAESIKICGELASGVTAAN